MSSNYQNPPPGVGVSLNDPAPQPHGGVTQPQPTQPQPPQSTTQAPFGGDPMGYPVQITTQSVNLLYLLNYFVRKYHRLEELKVKNLSENKKIDWIQDELADLKLFYEGLAKFLKPSDYSSLEDRVKELRNRVYKKDNPWKRG